MQEVILTTFEMNIMVSRLCGTSDDPQDHMTALGHDDRFLSEKSLEEIKEHLEKCCECGEWHDELYETKTGAVCLSCWNGMLRFAEDDDDDD